MVRDSAMVALMIVWAVGCGEGCGATPSAEASQVATSEPTGEAELVEEAPVDPGPPPEVQVTGTVDPMAREVALRVENHGEPAELNSAVALERQVGDAFRPVDQVEVSLRYDCDARPPECVSLTSGAVLLPPPWQGKAGAAQCGCPDCEPVPAGTYRAVIESCNGAHRVESEPFELP